MANIESTLDESSFIILRATLSTALLLTSARTTRAPCRIQVCAIADPRDPPAPVTKTTLFGNRRDQFPLAFEDASDIIDMIS